MSVKGGSDWSFQGCERCSLPTERERDRAPSIPEKGTGACYVPLCLLCIWSAVILGGLAQGSLEACIEGNGARMIG